MPHPYDTFRYLPLRVTLTAQLGVDMRDADTVASMVRNQFGAALVHATCRCVPTCPKDSCAHPNSCPLGAFFKANGESGRQPYVFYVPPGGSRYFQAGQPFVFYVTLVGSGIDYYPAVVTAIQRMAWNGLGYAALDAPGRWWLTGVEWIDDTARPTEAGQIYCGARASFTAVPRIRTWSDAARDAQSLNEKRVEIVELSRIWIKRTGANTNGIEYPTSIDLIAALLARLNDLSRDYCSAQGGMTIEDAIPPGSPIEIETVRDPASGRRIFLLTGDLAPLRPLLLLGSHVHIGKKTSLLGYGKYACR